MILDLTKTSEPKILNSIKTEGYALNVYVKDNIAYISDTGKGLVMEDISDINNPNIVGICSVPGWVPYFSVGDNIIFVEYVKTGDTNKVEGLGFQIFKLD